MSEPTRDPKTQKPQTDTDQAGPGRSPAGPGNPPAVPGNPDKGRDVKNPIDGMAPVIELEVNPGPPRPHIPPERKEGGEKIP